MPRLALFTRGAGDSRRMVLRASDGRLGWPVVTRARAPRHRAGGPPSATDGTRSHTGMLMMVGSFVIIITLDICDCNS